MYLHDVFHVITWRHDVTKVITWRQETNCLHLSLQMCSRADSIFVSVIVFGGWTQLGYLSSYLHDGITSRNDVMTSLNMLYLSQLVEVLERWFFFCFYSFLACLVQKCYRFCVCMMSWHVMTWRHDVTKLTSPISACRCSKVMIHIYFCRYFSCWVPSYYDVCTCMMFSCHNMTSWRH